jgi:RNA 2',3'-cyclic 3'-phosphodiesterase
MRLFLAVSLPQAVRQRLWDTTMPLRAAGYPVRWVGVDGLHVTLKFLGEVDEQLEADIVAGVERAVGDARTFPVVMTGFGVFPSPTRPRVVWAGCEANARLELIQHAIEREMDGLGFPIEGRAFRPHVTLGRAHRDATPRALHPLVAALEALEHDAEVSVQSVDLMQSTLSPRGARYACRQSVELTA